jgi:acetamidase/formamidase
MKGLILLVVVAAGPASSFAMQARMLSEEECATLTSASTGDRMAKIEANSDTVAWGYFYEGLEPVLYVNSGEEVEVEMVTHHAGDDYEKLIAGDPGLEDIYNWTASGMNVQMRGASGKGDGVHVLTGPIYVCGAEPGDVLQVDILDLAPRVNPATGKSFGVNAAAWWGYHFRVGFLDNDPREVITIYEIAKDGDQWYATPDYQFRFADPASGYMGPVSPSCTPISGEVPRPADGASNAAWDNSEFAGYPGLPANETVACMDGQQEWGMIYYPGIISQHPTGTENYDIRGKFKVPVNLHIGAMGLAPRYDVPVDSVPPMISGGNLDDKRIGVGATMFYPVQVEGALLSMGDAHTAQGDSELDGTGIETSVNGRFRITLHKADALPPKVQDLGFPLLENEEVFVVHGHAYTDYLDTFADAPGTIYSEGGDLNKAMANTYALTRDFMMRTFNLTEDQAITAMTVAVDFSITQVVDGNFGVLAVIPKAVFADEE